MDRTKNRLPNWGIQKLSTHLTMKFIKEQLFFILCLLLIGGLFLLDVIRILPSMSMIGITLLGLFYWLQKDETKIPTNTSPYLLLTLCFWMLLPSYLYSDNVAYFYQKLQLALPFLLLPLAFSKIPVLPKIQYVRLLLFFVIGTFLISLYAFINYLTHQDLINQMYLESKVMPTLVSHHPTFSMMIVFAIYLSYYLYIEKELILFKNEKLVLIIMGLFLFVFIHIFSVRSGLLALYLLVGIEILKLIFKRKQIKLAIYIGASLLLLGLTTMYLSPTVSNKITNTSADLQAINTNQSANNQSLSSRFISYKNALEINQTSSFWWGCGLGDIEDLNNSIFQQKYPDVSKPIIPHNQFLYYFASLGFIGLCLFIIGYFGVYFSDKSYTDSILGTHLVLSIVYFLVESPLVTQIGVAYLLCFLLLGLQQKLAGNR